MFAEWVHQETWLHKVNPSFKLILMAGVFVHLLTVHNPSILLNETLAVFLLFAFFTGHPAKRILLFSLPFLFIFLSTASSMILFGKGQTTWFRWGLIHITAESFYRGLHIGLRSLDFAMLGLTFALTTRPVLLFYSLMQQLKLPPKYAYSFMAGIRLIPLMLQEYQIIRYAMKVRGVESQKGLKGMVQKWKAHAIPLLSQSIRRAHRIAVAMEAKRFASARKRTYYYETGFSRYDAFFLLYFLLFFSLAYVLGNAYPYFPIHDVRYGP